MVEEEECNLVPRVVLSLTLSSLALHEVLLSPIVPSNSYIIAFENVYISSSHCESTMARVCQDF